MNIRQQRVLQSLRRSQAFCVGNPGLVPPPVGPPDAWLPLTRQFDAVNSIIIRMTDAAAQQGVQARQLTLEATDEPSLRKHLRDEMLHVTQVAQALRHTVPGIGSLRMPSRNMQVEGLLKAAGALAKQAFTYESVLVEHGLPTDFVAQLQRAVTTLTASVDGRGAARAGVVSATKDIAASISLAQQYVKIMDAALSKALRSNPAKLAEWKNAKRVTLKGVHSTPVVATPIATPMQLEAKAA